MPGADEITSYKNYPAIIENTIALKVNNNPRVRINHVFPKTLNSVISTSASSSDDKTTSTTQQHTSGSTTSNINTFGVNGNLGLFGETVVGGVGMSYNHSWESSHSKSDTRSSGTDIHQSISDSSSMTVKDWSAYSSLSEDHASWIVDFPDGIIEDEEINFEHFTSVYTASHQVGSDKKFSAQLQSNDKASTSKFSLGALNLSAYSLAPISDGAASIGFKIDPFTYAPKDYTDTLKVVAPVNNLQVTGTGFDSIMQTSFQSKPSIDIGFKIDNVSQDYSLIIVHWLENNSGACKLSWTINNKHMGSLIVDAFANNEGHNNATVIPLWQLDYASVNLQDYLVMGYNTIKCEIEQLDTKISSTYVISAITIR